MVAVTILTEGGRGRHGGVHTRGILKIPLPQEAGKVPSVTVGTDPANHPLRL